ncbi:unnamed protein product [Kuraishia capsulata CBS 1993]|uniref:Importin N-terminal domain-containing protein n=1 Tax=Kuraishia capsulata CBS 1993 TaxID=1382522 RepID=W6MXN5_9ASCO|nr:uncharacterized protein KUCA_T00005188001 [Kuraishia capsulata CBS 1993]CDK29200.1 unnamed protein product [Kuraishia capsulata CBS 1993]
MNFSINLDFGTRPLGLLFGWKLARQSLMVVTSEVNQTQATIEAMDKQGLLQLLQDTLSPQQQVRQNAEQVLLNAQKQSGLLLACLELAADSSQKQEVQAAAAIYFKNVVRKYWYVKGGVPDRLKEFEINPQEKTSIKAQLIPAIVSVSFSKGHVSSQLTSSLQIILALKDWPDLLEGTVQLLRNASDLKYVYTGLLCLKELLKLERYEVNAHRQKLNQMVEVTFPILEPLLPTLVQNFHDSKSGEMCYTVLKIFKYSVFTYLPPYLASDLNKLSSWCTFHLNIISASLPDEILGLEDDDRTKTQDSRSKAKKWAYGNLNRFQSRHGGGIASRKEDVQLAAAFCEHFTPLILNCYWDIISQWHVDSRKNWLSSAALYHLIGFMNECITIDATWPMIESKLSAILSHIAVPTLCATEATVELFEDEPEEYLRRFFDFSREQNTADVASSTLVYTLARSRFSESIPLIIQLLSELFAARQSNLEDPKFALQSEAGLRILGTVWDSISKTTSPVHHQLEDIVKSFVLPQLQDKKFPFLQARACETLSLIDLKFTDMDLLSKLFESTSDCLEKTNSLPLQVEAADALRFLVGNEVVERALAPRIPMIMSQLLDFSNRYEIDLINNIIDDFVLKFAKELEPFAVQLANNLCQQFLRLGSELIQLESENPNSADGSEKEYQAGSIMNTMTTMIFSMTSSAELTQNLLREFSPAISLVLDNALTIFSTEAMEILETANYTLKKMTAEMWHFFDLTLNAFNLYGNEYYEDYQAFFDTCVTYGFRDAGFNDQRVQKFVTSILELLNERQEEGEVVDFCYELLYSIVLAIGPSVSVALGEIWKLVVTVETNLQLSEELAPDFDISLRSFLKLMLSALYVCPSQVIVAIGPEHFFKYVELYFNNADEYFITVFDFKLQIMALMSLLLNIEQIPPLQSHSQSIFEKLLRCLEILPSVLTKRMELIKSDLATTKEAALGEEEEDWNNVDEQESKELTRDTALDSVNIYAEFKQFMANQTPQNLAATLPEDKQKLIQLLTSS